MKNYGIVMNVFARVLISSLFAKVLCILCILNVQQKRLNETERKQNLR